MEEGEEEEKEKDGEEEEEEKEEERELPSWKAPIKQGTGIFSFLKKKWWLFYHFREWRG